MTLGDITYDSEKGALSLGYKFRINAPDNGSYPGALVLGTKKRDVADRKKKELLVAEAMVIDADVTTKEVALRQIQRDIFAASARAAGPKRTDHDKVFDRYADQCRQDLAEVIRVQEGRCR